MTEEQRLIARALRYAREGERLTAAFVDELKRVLRASERELAELVLEARAGSTSAAVNAQRILQMRAQVAAILRANGYDVLVATATQAVAESIVKAALTGRAQSAITTFSASTRAAIEALRQLLALDLLEQGNVAVLAIWRALAQQVFGLKSRDELVRELAKVLDRSEAQIRSLFDTQVSIFTRTVEDLASGQLGPKQPYLYSGPADSIARDFCLKHVGTVMTREEIDKLDNGQLPNPFITGGGHNCRHVWLAVESPEMRALANTGKRIEGVSRDVAQAQRVKDAKAAKVAARKAARKKRKAA